MTRAPYTNLRVVLLAASLLLQALPPSAELPMSTKWMESQIKIHRLCYRRYINNVEHGVVIRMQPTTRLGSLLLMRKRPQKFAKPACD